jgi:hypothetical protein
MHIISIIDMLIFIFYFNFDLFFLNLHNLSNFELFCCEFQVYKLTFELICSEFSKHISFKD